MIIDRSTYRLPGPSRDGSSVHVTIPKSANVTSQTVATVPSNRARTRIGVGESVQLTFVPTGDSTGMVAAIGTWKANPDGVGTLSSTEGETITYTAPDRANSVTFTVTGGGYSGSIMLTIVEPSAVILTRRPGTKGNHKQWQASAGFIADIYILPADVSFENCSYVEGEAYAVGRGCFQAILAANKVGHDPNPNPLAIGPPTSDTSGSKVKGFDQIASFSDTNCDGGWTYTIPWYFLVGSGQKKQFASVFQSFDCTSSGTATVKKGDSNSSNYDDPNEVDPLFNQ